jgi:hypothetical protein
MEKRPIFSNDFICGFECFFIEIARDFRFTQHNSLLDWEDLNAFLFLFVALIEEPLASFHNVIMIQSVSSLAFFFGEIATETLENLSDVIFIYCF